MLWVEQIGLRPSLRSRAVRRERQQACLRRRLFGTNAVTGLIDPVQGLIGHDVPWLGLHTYGEIGTVAGAPRYHNYSVVLMALFAGSP